LNENLPDDASVIVKLELVAKLEAIKACCTFNGGRLFFGCTTACGAAVILNSAQQRQVVENVFCAFSVLSIFEVLVDVFAKAVRDVFGTSWMLRHVLLNIIDLTLINYHLVIVFVLVIIIQNLFRCKCFSGHKIKYNY
jgi:hypothetical protein